MYIAFNRQADVTALRSRNIIILFVLLARGTRCSYAFFNYFIYFPSHLISSAFFFLSLLLILAISQIRDHIDSRLFSALPATVRAFHFLTREDFSSFFPRRLPSNCAYPRYAPSAIDPFSFFCCCKYKFQFSPRTAGFELQYQRY